MKKHLQIALAWLELKSIQFKAAAAPAPIPCSALDFTIAVIIRGEVRPQTALQPVLSPWIILLQNHPQSCFFIANLEVV